MTFLIFSLGCKVNSYECSAVASRLIQAGYKEDKLHPEVIIINTCSVTATADQKSRQHIRKFINKYPNSIVVVMGCYSQGNAKYIQEEIHPSILLGTKYRNEIVELIEEYKANHQQIAKIDSNTRKFTYEELGITSFCENVRAYLKIQDGCDNFCSYCLIPFRRGKMRSRNKDYIKQEAANLVNLNYREVVLTGIHVGGYGRDLNDCSFSTLVNELLEIPNLYRLRISSIEESEIDDDLITSLKEKNNLAKHLHIPLQSGSETVLKRMNRKYTPDEFYQKIKKIKALVPNVAISTDVIVGFPGESEDEFQETVSFIKKCGFNMLHVFPFSPREGTLAYKMDNQIDPKIKNQRVDTLIKLSNELWSKYCESFINQEIELLIERVDTVKKTATGHTSNYLELEISLNDIKVGDIVKIKVEKSMIMSKQNQ